LIISVKVNEKHTTAIDDWCDCYCTSVEQNKNLMKTE